MFQGGAVLQRGVPAAVWGTSTASKVSVQLSRPDLSKLALSQDVPVNASGIWLLYMPPQPAGYGYKLTVSDSKDKVSVSVSFGEVILCAGQSNMGMQVGPSERAFDADNATAEAAAAERYTGNIFLHARTSRFVNATMWYDVTPISLPTFSAVCWYAGRDLWFHMGEKIPVGLIMNAVGAHPIEHWLGPDQIKACVPDRPLCRASAPNSKGWAKSIVPMQPFTIGTMLWDQGEQNFNCKETDAYACLTKQLVESYRAQFNSSFPFISVQLPAYTQPVFPMRLAQDEGSQALRDASIVPTYDDSCAMGKTNGCPHSNVHNVHKQPVGARLALQMRRMTLGEDIISQGPRVSLITIGQQKATKYNLKIEFAGSSALHMGPTRNCSVCCGPSEIGDFDASADGSTWFNGTSPVIHGLSANIVVTMPSTPSIVRYTANRLYPQCAVYGKEGIPALPFQTKIAGAAVSDVFV